MDSAFGALVVIFGIAVAAPLITGLSRRVAVPSMAVEIILGILVGPSVLGWVEVTRPIDLLAHVGLAALIFLVGFEIQPAHLRGEPIRLAAAGWILSVVLAVAASGLLQALGVIRVERYVALALTTTALAVILPVVRDAGILHTRLGVHLLAAGSVGEFGPILAMPLFLAGTGPVSSGLAIAGFTVVTVAVLVVVSRPRPAWISDAFGGSLGSSDQLHVRLAVLLIVSFTLVADHLGFDALLGGFAAGVLFRYFLGSATSEQDVEVIDAKFDGVFLGFLMPIFYVVVGVRFDLQSLTSSTAAMAKLPIFLCLLLVVRGAPAVLYRAELPVLRDRVALALFSSTGLTLMVAIVTIGVEADHMRIETADALIGAGLLSVLLFPLLARAVLRGQEDVGRA